MTFARITVRSDQMGGVACIRGLLIPVSTVVGMVADGMTEPEVLAAYLDLEAEDIREALRFASEADPEDSELRFGLPGGSKECRSRIKAAIRTNAETLRRLAE